MSVSLLRFIGFSCVIGLLLGEQAALIAQPENVPAQAVESTKSTPEDLDFFERKIRPVFEKHCVECHSEAAAGSNKLKGGLRVDSRENLLRGGDSGPAIVLKDAESSLLIQALRYDSIQMPPSGKLAASVVADFERWIANGAVDPRVSNPSPRAARTIDLEKGRQHWCYQPLRRSPVPPPIDAKSMSSIDDFIAAKLQAAGLPAAPDAEKLMLVRRVYFDLVGLPPVPDKIDEFLNDEAPDAYERLVDRLMASPHFGLRWGRHWLSVARFAESVTLRGLIQPEAWRYRDYVIDSFNASLSFDRFISEQLAGDLLPAESLVDRQRKLVATTYLTLGNHNLEEQDKRQLRMDVIDEQLDAIGKGFLAQTIGCARCHDHKFDPIPTRDYYALAGILANVKTLEDANVSKWLELPLPLEPDREAQLKLYETSMAAIQTKIESVKLAQNKFKKVSNSVVASKTVPGIVVDDRQAKLVGDWQQSQSIQPYIDDGYIHDKNTGKGDKTVTLLPELPKAGRYEVRLAYTPGDNRSEAVPVTVMSADGETMVYVNQKQRPAIDGLFVSLGQFRFELNGQGFVIVSTEGTTGHVIVDADQFLPVDGMDAATSAVTPSVGISKSDDEAASKLEAELKSLQRELKELQSGGPHRPRFMSVQEEQKIGDLRVHIRGTVRNLGDLAPRGFLQVAMTSPQAPFPDEQSGRLQLAEWIHHRDNPLTPRVFANRIWSWLFGEGLVRTVDNFGTTGELPSHPELLDELAVRLLERDWSVKPLIRDIVLSRTYRQTSASTSACDFVDPNNRLLAHQNLRRLDAECLLDSILIIGGQWDDAIGGNTILAGRTEDYGYIHRSNRRAVYWPVLRNALPEIFDVFDFADPSLPSGSRSFSTVASQSLYFMNDDWVAAQAHLAARRLLAEEHADDVSRVNRVFHWLLGRPPTHSEQTIALQTVSETAAAEQMWTVVIKALFASIDFRHVE